MPFQPQHIGLYFGHEQLTAFRHGRATNPVIQDALTWLDAPTDTLIRDEQPAKGDPIIRKKEKLTPLGTLLTQAYRYRFLDDELAGQEAAAALQEWAFPNDAVLLNNLVETAALAQLAEMLAPFITSDWRQQFHDFSSELVSQPSESYVAQLWQMLTTIVAGIVTEDEALFETGVERFRTILEKDIHPDGYFRPLVQVKDAQSFLRMTQATAAVTLAAEAATQAGVDLWAFQPRDISVTTPASYIVFFYFYPEKWRWFDGLTETDTQHAFTEFGAFIEMNTARNYLNGAEILLDDRRPLFSPYAGGLTSLSHFVTQIAPKRRNWLSELLKR